MSAAVKILHLPGTLAGEAGFPPRYQYVGLDEDRLQVVMAFRHRTCAGGALARPAPACRQRIRRDELAVIETRGDGAVLHHCIPCALASWAGVIVEVPL